MKKFLVLSAMILALPFTMNAQDDDMYFVPKKKSSVKAAKETYYSGSDRSTDEYNRRQKFEGSSVVPMDSTTMLARGLSPDSIYVDSHFAERLLQEYNENEDYRYSRELDRWYGVYDPWFYSRSIWAPYRHGWYNPWYGPSWAYYDPWYDPYYYGPAYFGWPSYSWYSPYYYYGGWWPYYGGYYGWYDPWFYGGYYGYYGWGHIGGGGHKYPNSNGIAGTSNHGRVTSPHYAHNGGRFNGPRNGASGSASSFAGGRRSAAAATSSYSSAGSSMGASRSHSGFSSSMGGSRGNSGASMNSGSSTRTSSSSNTYRSTNTSSTPSYTTSHSSSFSSSSSSGASRSSGSSGGGSRSGGSFGGGRR